MQMTTVLYFKCSAYDQYEVKNLAQAKKFLWYKFTKKKKEKEDSCLKTLYSDQIKRIDWLLNEQPSVFPK